MDVSLDGGAGLLRLMNDLFGYLGFALIFMPISSKVIWATLNKAPFLRPFECRWRTYPCIPISVSLDAFERRCLYTNIDLLVAGLQGVDLQGGSNLVV